MGFGMMGHPVFTPIQFDAEFLLRRVEATNRNGHDTPETLQIDWRCACASPLSTTVPTQAKRQAGHRRNLAEAVDKDCA